MPVDTYQDSLYTNRLFRPRLEAVTYTSFIFLREKKSKEHGLILNSKKFNKTVEYHHFKVDKLSTAVDMVGKNCFMVSVDLSDTYYSIHIAKRISKIPCALIWR